jgi:hypothetical protein
MPVNSRIGRDWTFKIKGIICAIGHFRLRKSWAIWNFSSFAMRGIRLFVCNVFFKSPKSLKSLCIRKGASFIPDNVSYNFDGDI